MWNSVERLTTFATNIPQETELASNLDAVGWVKRQRAVWMGGTRSSACIGCMSLQRFRKSVLTPKPRLCCL